jgi:hypothetical protein
MLLGYSAPIFEILAEIQLGRRARAFSNMGAGGSACGFSYDWPNHRILPVGNAAFEHPHLDPVDLGDFAGSSACADGGWQGVDGL